MGPSLTKVVWYDPKVYNAENTKYFEELKDGADIERFTNLHNAKNYI